MLSPKYASEIAVFQASQLNNEIENAFNAPSAASQTTAVARIDEFCREQREFWKRLNTTDGCGGQCGLIDGHLSDCIGRVLAHYNTTPTTSNHFVQLKLVSVLSTLFDCLSNKVSIVDWSQRCFAILRHTLELVSGKEFWKSTENQDDEVVLDDMSGRRPPTFRGDETTQSSASSRVLDALESRYGILEIFTTELRSKLSLDWDTRSLYGEYSTTVLTLLDRAAAVGKTKTVAKICSSLFKEVICWFSEENVGLLAKDMMRILRNETKDEEGHCTTETRCVGVHCLVNAMKEFITRKNGRATTSVAADSRSMRTTTADELLDDRYQRISTEFCALLESDSLLVTVTHRYLTSDKLFVRKCGRAILSSVLEHLRGKSQSLEAFADFLKLMEALELKQLHVVKPALGLLDTLVKYCQGAIGEPKSSTVKCFDVSWLRLVFHNALNHVNAYVVKWAVGKYFEIDSQLLKGIVGEVDCEFLFDVVLPVLDRSDAYYRFSEENGLHQFLHTLQLFLRGVVATWTPVTFWRKWLKVMKAYNRAPVALFYLSHVLSIISDDYSGQFGMFDDSDLETFRSIFWEFRQISLPFIRAAVQEGNLKVLFNLYTWNESTVLKACSKVISNVPTRLIRPENARRFLDQRNDFSWLLNESFPVKLINGQGTGDEHNDGSSWTMDGLHASVAVLSSIGQSSPTLMYSLFRPIVQNLWSAVKRTTLEDLNFWEMKRSLLLLTPWVEQDPNDAWRILEDEEAADLPGLVLDAVLWRICYGKNLDVSEVKLYTDFYNVFLAKERDCLRVGNVLQQLEKSYCASTTGDIRRYFILKAYAQCLEWSQKLVLRDGSTVDFLAHLILDEDEGLRNVEKRFEPLEWNRIVSEYASSKWQCLYLVCKATEEFKDAVSLLDWRRLAESALDALDVVSGVEEVHRVMRGIGYVLQWISSSEHVLVAKIVKKMFLICYEQRKSDQFVPTVRQCCLAVIQLRLLLPGYDDVLKEVGNLVHNFIMETENPSLACCVSEAINRSVIGWSCATTTDGVLTAGEKFLLKTLVELCCSGILLRKDQKMVYDASEMIKEFGAGMYKCVQLLESDNLASQKARLYAFHAVLSILEKSGERRHSFVECLVDLGCGKLLELICGATKNGYFANSQCHRVRTRAVQLLLLVEPFIADAASAIRLQRFTLRYLTEQNQQPSVRLLLEWLMTRLNLRFATDGLLEKWWEAEAYMTEKRVGTLCTWMEVLMHTGLCLPLDRRRQHALKCVKRWLPWCTAQNFTLRCCAQTCLRRVWMEEQCLNDGSPADKEWNLLYDFLTPTITFDKEQRNNTKNVEKASRDFYFSVFNAMRDYTLQTIFHTFPRLCFLPVDELIPVELWRIFAPDEKLLCRIPIENPSDELAKGNVFVWRDRTQEILAEEVSLDASYESLQTKTNLFSGGNDVFAEDLLDDARRSETTPRKDGLIVVATLVDRPTNLGGLCRTCEIFGAAEYAVSTYRIAEDFQFQVLSVSSERWVKMIEVKMADLMNYLKQKQSDGYTVVAVEQTTTSCRLTDYGFPAKTLLLLGNEKEGIPVDFLQCVDVCVEIPQLGHTRSLNVHVAGALLIWEYTKQRRFMK